MKPRLVLDCDEVILEFADPFARWLREEEGIALSYDSYALHGNMREAESGALVSPERIGNLVETFLLEKQMWQTPAEGALAAVRRLAERAEIVVLTNVPEIGEAGRKAHLAELGLDVPVIANSGRKGRAVARLAEGQRTIFVDDAPLHHESVAVHAPDVARLQLVASPVLHDVIPDGAFAHARHDRWAEALPWIEAALDGAIPPA